MKCIEIAMRITECPNIYSQVYHRSPEELRKRSLKILAPSVKEIGIEPLYDVLYDHIIASLGIIATFHMHGYITSKEVLRMCVYLSSAMQEFQTTKHLVSESPAVKKIMEFYTIFAPWADLLYQTSYLDDNGCSRIDEQQLVRIITDTTSQKVSQTFIKKLKCGEVTTKDVKETLQEHVNQYKNNYMASGDLRYHRSPYDEWFASTNLPNEDKAELVCALETPRECVSYFTRKYDIRAERCGRMCQNDVPSLIIWHEARMMCKSLFPLCVSALSFHDESRTEAKDFLNACLEQYIELVIETPPQKAEEIGRSIQDMFALCDKMYAMLPKGEPHEPN